MVATCGREQILIETLRSLEHTTPAECDCDIVVIDNGCAGAVRTAIDVAGLSLPINIIEPEHNLGPVGKQLGLADATTDFCIMLDDDARPRPGSIEQMLALFDTQPALAAAGFVPHLPDDSIEACALPDVFVGCGVGLRTEAVQSVGGLDQWFFMEAEEYDLAFRLANAGWDVGVYEELAVDHLKSPVARLQKRTLELDARNNAYLAVRYLPEPVRRSYMADWANRYRWMLEASGDARGFAGAWTRGTARGLRIRRRSARGILSPAAFEQLFRWNEIHEHMSRLASRGIERIGLVGLGKNILPFLNGAWHAKIEVAAIVDDRPFACGRTYHGISVVTSPRVIPDIAAVDAFVVSETSPARTRTLLSALESFDAVPAVGWFGSFTPAPLSAV